MTSNLQEKLREKTYRDAFVASQIRIALPFQMRALREQRGWTQAQLAEKTGMLQPRISAMERPGGSKFNLETVLRVAAALDVAFIGRFASFSELADWVEHFSPDTFAVPSFDDDPGFSQQEEATARIQTTTTVANNPLLAGTFPKEIHANPVIAPGAVSSKNTWEADALRRGTQLEQYQIGAHQTLQPSPMHFLPIQMHGTMPHKTIALKPEE